MAGVCYGADTTNEEKNYKRGLDCIKSNHGRTLEFPKVYLIIDRYSAKLLREIYTHIIDATRLQASTRYIDYNDFGYVTPTTIQENKDAYQIYTNTIETIRKAIIDLEVLGIPKEDASGLLPLNYESRMVVCYGLRELIAMSRVRMCGRAYWEFRKFFFRLLNSLAEYSPEWLTLVEDLTVFHPKCEEYGYCNEKFSCGRMPKKEKDQYGNS